MSDNQPEPVDYDIKHRIEGTIAKDLSLDEALDFLSDRDDLDRLSVHAWGEEGIIQKTYAPAFLDEGGILEEPELPKVQNDSGIRFY